MSTVGSCTSYLKNGYTWYDMAITGESSWTCCLATEQTPPCPVEWTAVTDPLTADELAVDPHAADYTTHCSSTSCCKAHGSYAGTCAHYFGFPGYTFSQKSSWGAGCGATWAVYPTMKTVPDCSQCIGRNKDCTQACAQAFGWSTSGTCAHPGSTNAGDCCACF